MASYSRWGAVAEVGRGRTYRVAGKQRMQNVLMIPAVYKLDQHLHTIHVRHAGKETCPCQPQSARERGLSALISPCDDAHLILQESCSVDTALKY